MCLCDLVLEKHSPRPRADLPHSGHSISEELSGCVPGVETLPLVGIFPAEDVSDSLANVDGHRQLEAPDVVP